MGFGCKWTCQSEHFWHFSKRQWRVNRQRLPRQQPHPPPVSISNRYFNDYCIFIVTLLDICIQQRKTEILKSMQSVCHTTARGGIKAVTRRFSSILLVLSFLFFLFHIHNMAHFRKAESIATNTLLIPDVPATFFGCDDALLTLHDAFAEFGPIYTFVPMKGFRRLMIIYQETVHAMKAKQALDRHSIVYREREPFPEIVTYAKVDSDTEQVWRDAGNVVLQLRVYYGQVIYANKPWI